MLGLSANLARFTLLELWRLWAHSYDLKRSVNLIRSLILELSANLPHFHIMELFRVMVRSLLMEL